MKISFTFFFAVFFAATSFAGDIDKAFKYLNTGDYPNAYKFLREVLQEEPQNAAANYGMAKYFSMSDNKAYHLDSANFFIKKAAEKIPLKPDDKQTKKFLALGVRDATIEELLKSINFKAYSEAERINTLESYQHFIDEYTDKAFLAQAINFRNQKGYIRALSQNNADSLAAFIQKYPEAKEMKEAKAQYEKMIYERTTADKNFSSYKKYMDAYPNGKYFTEAKKNFEDGVLQYYVSQNSLDAYIEFEKKYKDHPAFNDVQDSIYLLATKAGTVDAYKNFVHNYSQNRNVQNAWEQLYIISTSDATENSYQKFSEEFPDYPNKERLYNDLEFSKKELKPFSQGDKWGYAYQPTKDSLEVVIPFEYEEAFEFKSGYAAVRLKPCEGDKCIYFYIDKKNNRVFPADFNYAGDFINGFAVVGFGDCEGEDLCKYGVIDKRGNFIVKPEYDEVDEANEGFFLVAQNEKYGFFNTKGEEVISLKYTNALPFSEGIAAVAIDDNWFFIDTAGAQKFINVFRDVSKFKESLCAVTLNGNDWGYIDTTGEFVIKPAYESAGDFENGVAIVSKRERDAKNKSLYTSQRYKIDRTGKVIEKLTAPAKVVPQKSLKKKRK